MLRFGHPVTALQAQNEPDIYTADLARVLYFAYDRLLFTRNTVDNKHSTE